VSPTDTYRQTVHHSENVQKKGFVKTCVVRGILALLRGHKNVQQGIFLMQSFEQYGYDPLKHLKLVIECLQHGIILDGLLNIIEDNLAKNRRQDRIGIFEGTFRQLMQYALSLQHPHITYGQQINHMQTVIIEATAPVANILDQKLSKPMIIDNKLYFYLKITLARS
jgi:hypothetical protein